MSGRIQDNVSAGETLRDAAGNDYLVTHFRGDVMGVVRQRDGEMRCVSLRVAQAMYDSGQLTKLKSKRA